MGSLKRVLEWYIAVRVDLPNNWESQSISGRIQTAQMLAQEPRKHRNDPLHEVDTGGALGGVLVDERVLANEVAHVGDVHAHFVEAITKFGHV